MLVCFGAAQETNKRYKVKLFCESHPEEDIVLADVDLEALVFGALPFL